MRDLCLPDKSFNGCKIRYYRCIEKHEHDYDVKNYKEYTYGDIILINGINLHIFALFVGNNIIPMECYVDKTKKKINNTSDFSAYEYYETDENKFIPERGIDKEKHNVQISYSVERI